MTHTSIELLQKLDGLEQHSQAEISKVLGETLKLHHAKVAERSYRLDKDRNSPFMKIELWLTVNRTNLYLWCSPRFPFYWADIQQAFGPKFQKKPPIKELLGYNSLSPKSPDLKNDRPKYIRCVRGRGGIWFRVDESASCWSVEFVRVSTGMVYRRGS